MCECMCVSVCVCVCPCVSVCVCESQFGLHTRENDNVKIFHRLIRLVGFACESCGPVSETKMSILCREMITGAATVCFVHTGVSFCLLDKRDSTCLIM